jgi:ABC-2 type transport system permease protein
LRNTLAIAGRELRLYFGTPSSYIIIAVFLFVCGYGFGWSRVTYLETSLQGFMGWGAFFLLFLGPALTMRLLAEEEKLGTIELLLTAPVRDIEVVLGKYLAGLGVLSIMLALTLYYPVLLAWFGDPDWGPIAGGYLGFFLLGAVFLSIGLFASSLTSSQIAAYMMGTALVLSLWFVGHAAGVLGEKAAELLHRVSVSNYFPAFGRGVLDTNAVVYYVSIICVFIFLTVRSLESRRWR